MSSYKILFLGDSVTDAHHSTHNDPYGCGYVSMIYNNLNCIHNLDELKVTNSGYNGHRSKDLLNRIDSLLENEYTHIFVLIGVNDSWRKFDYNDETPVSAYKNNIEKLINIIKNKSRAKLVLLSPFVLRVNELTNNIYEDLYPKQNSLKDLAVKHNLDFIDLQQIFDYASRNYKNTELAGDGIHPSILGHSLIATAILNSLLDNNNNNSNTKGFIDNFQDLKYKYMRYRFFKPKKECDTLILHLHGSGGRGNDNIKNLEHINQVGFHTLINEELAYILVPQIPEPHRFFDILWTQTIYDQDSVSFGEYLSLTHELLLETIKKYNIKHVFVEGFSMGGYATIDIATRFPELFDGIFVICGGFPISKLEKIKNKKVIIVHGDSDPVVPNNGSIEAYKILKSLDCNVELHIVENCQHDSWNYVYSNPTMLKEFIKKSV